MVSREIQIRERKIVRTSIIGVIANIFLAAFKAFIGVLTHSVAITMDAINNATDACSSLITIIGTKLAAREPDKKHPLGQGRLEYLSTLAISALILYAGITALYESVKKILKPAVPEYDKISLLIIVVAVIVKIVLGIYVTRVGKKVDSDSLLASGKDALFDSVISAATLVAALIFMFFGLSLESYLGAIISIIIIKSGIEIFRETVSELIGARIDPELAKEVKQIILSFPEVKGAYDLFLHNYGPNRLIGSVHIEVPETMTARELDKLEREISYAVAKKTGVIMAGVSVYSYNTSDSRSAEIENVVKEVAYRHQEVLEVHGFYYEEEKKLFRFDIIIDYDYKNRDEIFKSVVNELKAMFPDYKIVPTLDVDMSD